MELEREVDPDPGHDLDQDEGELVSDDDTKAARFAEEPFLLSFASFVKAATCFCSSRLRIYNKNNRH